MEQQTLTAAKLYVRDLVDGQSVDSVFTVRERVRRQKKNGDVFVKLQLGDVTGCVEAVIWDGVDQLFECCAPGQVVRVAGSFSVDQRYGSSLTVRSLRPAEPDEYDPLSLEEGPPHPVEQMVADLRSLVDTMQDPYLRELLERCFAEGSEIWERWREAPAAKYYHQAYRHGLLEHCGRSRRRVSARGRDFPGIDRDVAVCGALLHDIGKLEAYAGEDGAHDLTDAGKLQGEIPLGYYRVRRADRGRSPASRPTRLGRCSHIMLAHHGCLEHGSPVVPGTREATLVHSDRQPQRPARQLRPHREGASPTASAGRATTAP